MLIMHTMLLMNSCQYNMKICISYEYIIYFHNKIAICALGECKYAHVFFSSLAKGSLELFQFEILDSDTVSYIYNYIQVTLK